METQGKEQVRTGFNMVFSLTKSKQCSPYQEVEVPFYFTGKLDLISALVDAAVESGVIGQAGAFYSYGDSKYQGRKKLIAYLEANPDVKNAIWEEVRSASRQREA